MNDRSLETKPGTKLTGPIRMLALGDSYTIGENVERQERWPIQLARRLTESGIEVSETKIVAETGWTTDELDAAIDREMPLDGFDLVFLLIGVNNQYRRRSLEEYKNQFAVLLERAIEFSSAGTERVFVVSIPDWGVTPFAASEDQKRISKEIDAFNSAARQISEANRVRFVDVTGISRKATDDGSLLADDGLHPSARMYRQWCDKLLPVLVSLNED